MVTSWFPEHERASAVGFYTSGQFVGLAFLTPLLIWIQEMLSWHWVFIVTGGIGIIWSLIWFKVYQPPRLTKGISKAELDYIRDGGGLVDGDAPVKKEARQPLTAKDWKLVFHRKLIGVYLGQFAVASTLWFFLTWFPNYLTQEKGITALKAGFMTTVPFLAAFIGVLLSGWVADLLVRKGFSLGFARKTPIICGLLISTCIMGANYTNDPMMIMCLMALAFFGNGFASITWSLVSSLAPMRLIGLTGGVFNFAGGRGRLVDYASGDPPRSDLNPGAGRHCVRNVVRSGDIANKNAGRSLHPVTVNYLLVAGGAVHRDLTRSLLCCTDHSHRLLAPVFSPLAHEFTHAFRRRSPFAGTERDTSALWIDCLRHTHHRQHGSNSRHNWLGRPGRSAHCPLVDRS